MWHFFLMPCADFLQLLGTCFLELAKIELSHLYLGIRAYVGKAQLVVAWGHNQT